MQFRWRRGALGIAALALVCQAQPALSAESATSVYLLGSKGTLAGMTPPPGLYISDANYYYSGDASGTAAKGVTLRRTGTTVSVSTIDLDITTVALAQAWGSGGTGAPEGAACASRAASCHQTPEKHSSNEDAPVSEASSAARTPSNRASGSMLGQQACSL